MKIDVDLRAAIRSAEKSQPDIDWTTRNRLNKEAAQTLVSLPKYKAKFAKAVSLEKRIATMQKEANTILKSLGIKTDFRISDESTFIKAGGKYPMPNKRWKFDAAVAELAAAKPNEAKAILAKYKIIWE